MSRILVTGAAGFIGSHTVREAARRGHEVVAVDNFNSYYDPERKASNASWVLNESGVRVIHLDLVDDPISPLIDGMSSVIHLAGQPGVRSSWKDFDSYSRDNLIATNRLLEACISVGVPRIIYASSSSVYGNAMRFPVVEGDPTLPFSPYGVSKLAAEHLVRAYSQNFGIQSFCLRYFTVYGPRQRPDMAFHRLIKACLEDTEFVLFGDGSQIRDFTYIDDVVAANILGAETRLIGDYVFNVSGGSSTTMAEVIQLVQEVCGKRLRLRSERYAAGDVFRTGGSALAIAESLGWNPEVSLARGLEKQASSLHNGTG